MCESDYDKIIHALVAAAPPLTEEQRWKLSVLMYPEGIHLRKPDFAKIQSVLLLNEYRSLPRGPAMAPLSESDARDANAALDMPEPAVYGDFGDADEAAQ